MRGQIQRSASQEAAMENIHRERPMPSGLCPPGFSLYIWDLMEVLGHKRVRV